MKILFVSPYVPVPPTFGGALRIYNVMKQAARFHELALVAYGTPASAAAAKEWIGPALKEVHVLPPPWSDRYKRFGQIYSHLTNHSFFYQLVHTPAMQALIDSVLRRERYDIVQSEFSVTGTFEFRTDGIKILDAHNVEYDNFRRMSTMAHSPVRRYHYAREFVKFRREEIAACSMHDAVFVTSQRDKHILDCDIPSTPKFIVPNGVDTGFYSPGLSETDPYSIVFTGMMGYLPNGDGMRFFLDEIFPRILRTLPQATITIVGKQPPPFLLHRASPNIIVTGAVEDVRPFVRRSAVYVIPLRMGGGTRLKALEAMSMKIPIVTTSIGCEGIDVKDGETVMMRDDPDAFAEAVIEVMTNWALRQRLTDNAFDLVHRQYEWHVIGEAMEHWYRSFFDSKRTVHHRRSAVDGIGAMSEPAGMPAAVRREGR
jgi:glycosyltransferase involved in cell wall biosynthesis